MQLTKQVENSIYKNKAFIIEQRTLWHSCSNFALFAAIGICAVLQYQMGNYWFALVGALLAVATGYDFYSGKSYYALQFPKDAKPRMLFKIKDIYFVGGSLEEAQLFATLHDVDAQEVQQVVDAKAYAFD